MDFDPYCFEKLLSYLRARQVDEVLACNTPVPVIVPDKRHEFWGFIKYMGLDEYMGRSYAGPCFLTCDPKLYCSHNGQVTRTGCGTEGSTAFADQPILAGEVHHYKVHLQKLCNPVAKLFLGVGQKVETGTGDEILNTSICGWASPASVVTDGVSYVKNSLLQWQPEDFVRLKVDLQNWCLTLTTGRASFPVKLQLSSDNKDCLVLLVTMYGRGQQVQLVPVEAEDQLRLEV